MLQESSSLLENTQTVKMYAIMEEWDEASGQYTENTNKYFMILLIKFGLETAVFYACSPKKYTYFLSVCSLSLVLADFLLALSLGAAWFLGSERFLVLPCFFLAKASIIYGVLPLPMMTLGLVDYSLENIFMSDRLLIWKTLQNVLLTLLVWAFAINHSFQSESAGLVELVSLTEVKALVCQVKESQLIAAFSLGLFTASFLTLVPFWSRIPQWVREIDRMLVAREDQKNAGSDLPFMSTWNRKPETRAAQEEQPEDSSLTRPPLWFSMTLGFLLFWMPYLVMSVSCLIFSFGIPAYLAVNLLWLECSNSLLVGLVFWAKSGKNGPYSTLPENVCLWQVYWHLSRDIRRSLPPVAVFHPSCGKKDGSLHV